MFCLRCARSKLGRAEGEDFNVGLLNSCNVSDLLHVYILIPTWEQFMQFLFIFPIY